MISNKKHLSVIKQQSQQTKAKKLLFLKSCVLCLHSSSFPPSCVASRAFKSFTQFLLNDIFKFIDDVYDAMMYLVDFWWLKKWVILSWRYWKHWLLRISGACEVYIYFSVKYLKYHQSFTERRRKVNSHNTLSTQTATFYSYQQNLHHIWTCDILCVGCNHILSAALSKWNN